MLGIPGQRSSEAILKMEYRGKTVYVCRLSNKVSMRQMRQYALRQIRARIKAPPPPERLVRSYSGDGVPDVCDSDFSSFLREEV